MGASISTLGKILVTNQNILRKVGGILIIIFEIHMTGLLKIKKLYSEKRLINYQSSNKTLSSIPLGMPLRLVGLPALDQFYHQYLSMPEV
jgi:cytochrome c-type biogenesis protein